VQISKNQFSLDCVGDASIPSLQTISDRYLVWIAIKISTDPIRIGRLFVLARSGSESTARIGVDSHRTSIRNACALYNSTKEVDLRRFGSRSRDSKFGGRREIFGLDGRVEKIAPVQKVVGNRMLQFRGRSDDAFGVLSRPVDAGVFSIASECATGRV
jgi:hypothetical protein